MGEIRVQGVGKAYRDYPSKWSRLIEWTLPFLGKRHQLKWVLKDINFKIEPGSAVAIVGFNGAGKSTLLKIIAGTLKPTEGQLSVSGNVAALLELGMGFHEQFTGRQNAYMAGQLLGYSLEEIDSMMPEIEQFAEIGDYIDRPLRTYSSGMHVRLAFSIATARRPEVLIVDEALSVGDAYFQHKSFDRIKQFKEQGTTLLIVSHDRLSIEMLCDQAILINNNRVELQGAAGSVMDYYNALMAHKEQSHITQDTLPDGSAKTTSGSKEATTTNVLMYNGRHEQTNSFDVGDQAYLVVDIQINTPVKRLVLGFLIKNKYGQEIYGINTHRLKKTIENPQVGQTLRYTFSFPTLLGPGNYSISLSVSQGDSHIEKNFEWTDRAFVFHVINRSKEQFVGCNWLDASVEISANVRGKQCETI